MATATPIDILTSDSKRPVIRIRVGDPQASINAAIDALARDPNLYARDTDLVHVARVTREEAEESAWVDASGHTRHENVEGTPQIRVMSLATLRVRMCSAAEWIRTKETREGPEDVRCEPSRALAEEVRDEGRWPGIRYLAGIAETPTMRPDGTVIQGRAHYDRVTGYLYEPAMRFPRVADAPTLADAKRSYAALADLFADFPFASPAGVSAAVSAICTVVCRPAIRGPVPAYVVDATTPGTGKTLLVDTISAIATGRESGRTHFPAVGGRDGDSELQKRLGMLAILAPALVNFDNADEAAIGGDVLEEVITTRDQYLFRILGKTEGRNLPVRMVFLFTANNAQWSRGMNRRILHVRLESRLENPEQRGKATYKHPERAGRLFEYALENRAEYVRHALTIVRAYVAAGRPAPLTLGTFEAWAALIPSAIVWAGGVDPMLCRPSQSGEDSPETMQRRTLAREWHSFCRDSGIASITAHDMIARLYPTRDHGEPLDPKWDMLRGAIESFIPPPPGRSPDPAKLGDLLSRRFKGAALRTQPAPAPLQAFCLEGKTGGRARWRVADVADEGAPVHVPAPVSAPVEVSPPPAPAVEVSPPEDEPAPAHFGPEDPSDVLAYLDAPAGYEAAYADPCDEYPRE